MLFALLVASLTAQDVVQFTWLYPGYDTNVTFNLLSTTNLAKPFVPFVSIPTLGQPANSVGTNYQFSQDIETGPPPSAQYIMITASDSFWQNVVTGAVIMLPPAARPFTVLQPSIMSTNTNGLPQLPGQ